MNKLEVLERLLLLEDALFDAEFQLKKLNKVKNDSETLSSLVLTNDDEKRDLYDAIFSITREYKKVKNFELCFADSFKSAMTFTKVYK